jgi:hypothetical protein
MATWQHTGYVVRISEHIYTERPLVKLSYFTLEKSFFFIYNQFFFINIKAGHCCEGSPKTIKTRSLIGNMGFGGFPKKIRNKTFYFHCKKKFTIFFFYFVLALESISGGKSRLFGQTPLNIIFCQKLSNCHISLWRKVFFPFFSNFFFHLYQSCPMLRGVTKKIKEPSRLLGTWYLAVFQKKLGTKLFIFTVKFFSLNSFFT